ncbi:MAG: hypothetical protein ACKN9V_00920 [Pseudomonadota bacterium]
MKRWRFNLAVIFLAQLTSLVFGDDPAKHQELKTILRNSDYGYRTRIPTGPVHIPGLSGESTPEEIEFNKKILGHPQKCLFQGEDSVEGEGWVNTSRIKVIPKFTDNIAKNSEEFLKACQAIKAELGPKACSVIEIAGHANGVSIGLGKILGFRLTEGKWEHFPKDKNTFKEIVQCLKDISWDEAPVVFCSCGAETCDDDFPIKTMAGVKLHYPNKLESQQYMTNLLGRKVISALGAENVQDWGKHCRNGWCITEPKEKVSIETIDEFEKFLPEPKVQWEPSGKPLH